MSKKEIKKNLKVVSDPNMPSAPIEIIKLNTLLKGLHEESDRGACLIAGAYLDEILEDILKDFLVEDVAVSDLFDAPNAPVGSFWSKCILAFSLGLIEKVELQEMNLIRKIRNDFAHAWVEINFDTTIISKEVMKLPWRGPEDDSGKDTPRNRFIFAVSMLLGDLLWRKQLVVAEKRKPKTWSLKAGTVRYY